jgi:cell division protein FtsB
MGHRVVPAILIALLVMLHTQLWFGRGSLPNVNRLTEQLRVQNEKNQRALLANSQLAAEVRDLQEGLEMVEEKARSEIGMVKPDEIYVQITH